MNAPTILVGTVMRIFCGAVLWACIAHIQLACAGPYAFTMPATINARTNAVLRGMATPNGLPSSAWFEWGTSRAYGNRSTALDVGVGNDVIYVTNQISGTSLAQDYHFRLAVSNSLGTTYGADQVFACGKRIWAWGSAYMAQMNAPSELTNIVAVAGGLFHGLALRNDGTVAGWGGEDAPFGFYGGPGDVPSGLGAIVGVAGGGTVWLSKATAR